MNLQEQLKNNYPNSWFQGVRFFGFECGDGWFQIIKDLFDELVPLTNDLPDFRILQIKEKFGNLRVYVCGGNDAIEKAIKDAEAKSDQTCDRCGNKGTKNYDGWISVRCEQHQPSKVLER